ncbi:MAG TPA: VOC family protein [Mycobacteriales bacterium]|nr:VOC family protein [Mycobacteriales bacterium]
MDYKLEVIVLPVADVERAKAFYVDGLGFHLDADTEPMPGFRVVHMTPPGSACSVVLGPITYDPANAPATRARFQLVVTDLKAARAELAERGVETSEIQQLDPRDGGSFSYLADPDGNEWALQEIRDRIGADL